MFFEDKGEFYIVDLHTPEGLQVCVVPDIWCYYVDDKFCCVWPHFHQTKEIKSRTQPKREWASFYADKRNKTFGSYNEAKAKEITATQKTDLASEPEDLGRGKRVRGMRRPFSPAIDYHLDSSSCSEEEGASQLMKNGLPPAPFLLPVAQSTALSDEGTPGYYSSLPNEENAVSPTQEICSQLISSPITSPQSSNEVEDRSMQIHGQVQRMNSGASGSTCTENVVAGSSGTPACGSSGTMGTFNRYVVSQQDFHILRALKQVNATMKEMDRKILSIDKKVEKTATEETTFADIENFPVSFPLANVEKFIKLEDILNEDPSKAAIVYQLVKSCGGMSESDAICRAWIKITSIECRSDCNWKGVKRGTHQKHGLELSSIKDAVLRNQNERYVRRSQGCGV
ncbi:uncharacterized protein LOC116917074 isoform X1 [Daphnia magna]|uniref:uncharacterized protein LOC116917074 isoform X1 n=1 Tax=Daphnia magna TaxID=35525 RepID=UPI001E1BA7B6|nr:uncharacterized protein LOC116917074 isoform X1 [Daphnia magna]XP_045030693.1 uncharacterized protein LOC116917074 isoform X1 [Daphnia magna]XP_045030699.1 uncharacterized protein LOC116917074 isoform X1 [Daphnia magna]XP_045030702.1 uncharacterized protein LOC116917074 isoform X1 [Daphnia magna]XP_045030707.1 uncharacterized protein LOC116917074 isoform X1 [Daphnia magna]XP_045030711.1 uncharacterized protein LOC116917074 isoform X1 [Daphnia magna]